MSGCQAVPQPVRAFRESRSDHALRQDRTRLREEVQLTNEWDQIGNG